MILSHDPLKDLGGVPALCACSGEAAAWRGYDAVKLTAAYDIPGHCSYRPAGVAWQIRHSKIEIRYHRPGLLPFIGRVRLIHVVLMILYERKGAVVMTHILAYWVIHTRKQTDLRIFGMCLSIRTCREERIAEFVRQIRDPYLLKCGGFVVRASFSQGGATLEECLRGVLR